MRPGTYWLLVLALLAALAGQCAGTESRDREPVESVGRAVTVAAAGCDAQGATR